MKSKISLRIHINQEAEKQKKGVKKDMKETNIELKVEKYTPAPITWNYEAVKSELNKKLEEYRGLVYTEENVQDAKRDRAKLKHLKDDVNEKRKNIEKQYMAPLNEFKGQVKELQTLIEQPIAEITSSLNAFEDQRIEKRKEEILAYYNNMVNSLTAFPEDTEDSIKEHAYQHIFDESWLNVTCSMKKYKTEISSFLEEIKKDIATIQMIEPDYQDILLKVYYDSFDMSSVLSKKSELDDQKRKLEEKIRKEQEAEALKKKEAEMKKQFQEQLKQESEQQASEPVHNMNAGMGFAPIGFVPQAAPVHNVAKNSAPCTSAKKIQDADPAVECKKQYTLTFKATKEELEDLLSYISVCEIEYQLS